MNIILENQNSEEIKQKYILLELDKVKYSSDGESISSYCVIDKEHITLQEIPLMEYNINLHNNLINNYRLKNWKFCEDAFEHLVGKFQGECDSFYNILSERIKNFKETDPGKDWDFSIIIRQ